jgi:hypothetical protein
MPHIYFEYFELETTPLKLFLNIVLNLLVILFLRKVYKDLVTKNLDFNLDTFHDFTIMANVSLADGRYAHQSQYPQLVCLRLSCRVLFHLHGLRDLQRLLRHPNLPQAEQVQDQIHVD